jgi:hypothetical protein
MDLEDKMEEIKEVKEKVVKKHTKECKVYWIHEGLIGFEFDGYGISAEYKSDKPVETIKVEYTGQIGTPDFKYKVK